MDVRAAERRVWGELGLEPIEHRPALGRTGTTVRVREVGEGPPAVLVPGASVSGTSWADLAAAPPDGRWLLVDRPGCGDRDPLPGSLDSSRLLAVADHLVVDVHVVASAGPAPWLDEPGTCVELGRSSLDRSPG